MCYFLFDFMFRHFVLLRMTPYSKRDNKFISTEAKLHQQSIVVDLHIDPIIQQALFGYHLSDAHAPSPGSHKKDAGFITQLSPSQN